MRELPLGHIFCSPFDKQFPPNPQDDAGKINELNNRGIYGKEKLDSKGKKKTEIQSKGL